MNYKKEYKKLKADIENAYLFAQTDSTKAVLEHILPELAESDDEKIRKTLIDYFDEANKVDENQFELFGIHTDKVLAWLEKQGEVDNLHNYLYGERNVFYKVGDWVIRCTEGFKHNIYLVTEVKDYYVCEDLKGRRVTFTFNDVHKNFRLWNISDAKDGDVLVDGDNNIGLYRGEKDNFWESYIYLGCNNYLYGFSIGGYHEHKNTKPATKEQRDLLFKKIKESGHEWDTEKKELNKIEQKPADKVEPKFKVGDYLVNDYCKGKVIALTDDAYLLDTEQGIPFSYEHNAHLWTIQDAEDGDVLQLGKVTAIFKEYTGNGTCRCYCSVCEGEFEIPADDGFDNIYGCYDTYPATKEQRDILFTKMHEAGYEWDTEKKESKKVEPKFKVGDWVVDILYDKAMQVLFLEDDGYELDNGIWVPYTDAKERVHLWSIKDAKDGDVLVTVYGKRPFIYKGCLDPNHPDLPVAYCGIVSGYFCRGGDNHWWTDEKVQPATKEQRVLLFSKMKEAGYEWDDEKKEPRVIDWSKHVKCEPIDPSIIEEKSVWTEEDEENLNQLHKLIVKKAYEEYEIDTEDETLWGKHAILDNWLKSLKERIKGGH